MNLILTLMLALSSPVLAQRAIMEGVAASRYTIKVDTTNGRVEIGTTSYTGGIANVGLFVASNVVVGTLTQKNACVIYATGSVTCLGVVLGPGESNTYTSSKTFTGDVLIGSSSTASAFFGDGSHLTGVLPTTVHVSSISSGFTSSFSPAVGHTFTQCVTTVTVTTSVAGPLRVWYSGSINSNQESVVGATFLLDSGFATGLNSTTLVMQVWIRATGNYVQDGSWSWVTQSVAAGSHTACLGPTSDSGNVRTCKSAAAAGVVDCQFGIESVP